MRIHHFCWSLPHPISKSVERYNSLIGGISAGLVKKKKSPREIEGLRGTESPRKFRESQRVPESPRGSSKKTKHIKQTSGSRKRGPSGQQRCSTTLPLSALAQRANGGRRPWDCWTRGMTSSRRDWSPAAQRCHLQGHYQRWNRGPTVAEGFGIVG